MDTYIIPVRYRECHGRETKKKVTVGKGQSRRMKKRATDGTEK